MGMILPVPRQLWKKKSLKRSVKYLLVYMSDDIIFTSDSTATVDPSKMMGS